MNTNGNYFKITKTDLKADFSQIPNQLITLDTLNNTEKMILIYMFSNSESFKLSTYRIQVTLKVDARTVKKTLEKCKELKYIIEDKKNVFILNIPNSIKEDKKEEKIPVSKHISDNTILVDQHICSETNSSKTNTILVGEHIDNSPTTNMIIVGEHSNNTNNNTNQKEKQKEEKILNSDFESKFFLDRDLVKNLNKVYKEYLLNNIYTNKISFDEFETSLFLAILIVYDYRTNEEVNKNYYRYTYDLISNIIPKILIMKQSYSNKYDIASSMIKYSKVNFKEMLEITI